MMPPMTLRIDERRVEWGNVWPPGIIGPFESAKRGVKAEGTKNNKNRNDFNPPGIAAQGAAKSGLWQDRWRISHRMTSGVCVAYSKYIFLQTKSTPNGEGRKQVLSHFPFGRRFTSRNGEAGLAT